jgi:hypothetical protein
MTDKTGTGEVYLVYPYRTLPVAIPTDTTVGIKV